MRNANSETFNEMTNEGLKLVDFWASWCGPCKMLAPILDEISTETNDFEIIKVEVDENPELAAQYEVMSVPTLFIMKDGQIVDQMQGFQPKENILNKMQQHI